MNKINWNELFKIRIANSSKEFQKHEVVKLLLVMKLLEKHRKNKNFIRIYTEYELENGIIADVYFEDNKEKVAYAFEIQKKYTKQWIEERTKQYLDWNVTYMNSSDWCPINLNKLSNDLEELDKQLEEYIF
jgi:hypothetical protein